MAVAPVGSDDRDLVLGGVEANARLCDVVDDDGVEALAGELAAAVLDSLISVLGGEADQRLVRPASARQGFEDVGRWLKLDRRDALVLLDLRVPRVRRAKVGDRGAVA